MTKSHSEITGLLRFKPPEYGISSATQSTFAPSSVMRPATLLPNTPLSRSRPRRTG